MNINDNISSMKRVNAEEGQSVDLVTENIERLKDLFPEAFSEGNMNFETLRQLLGDVGVFDEGEERYGLNWHGKKKARQIALTPSAGTLLPCPEESLDWDTTQNLFIEGDNLEVLKLLQKSYANKVKMIYIDPPYNTGKEFVYPDRFQDNLDTYLKYTGQIDSQGIKFSSSSEASGRKHTNWLNMMYPRLKLARSLLSKDGVIFISIDDNEQSYLKSICDEIFGENNFYGVFIWEKKKKPSFLKKSMGVITDYILVYAKNYELAPEFTIGETEIGKKYPFNNSGNGLSQLSFPPESVIFNLPDGVINAQDMSEGNIVTRLTNNFEIRNGKNVDSFTLEGEWRYSQKKVDEFIEGKEEILISKVPFRPNYINRNGTAKKIANFLSSRVNGVPTNEDASSELVSLLGGNFMDYPKPVGLIKYLIEATLKGDDNPIVLDFFAGSATTAHASLISQVERTIPLRTISVQLPEKIDDDSEAFKAGYKTIAEIAKERIRRAAKKINDEYPESKVDLGFKVFKLARSNIKLWKPDHTDLESNLLEHEEHLDEGTIERDILYELLIKRGVDLAAPIEKRIIAGKNVFNIGFGKIITCLDDLVVGNDVESLAAGIISWQTELKELLDIDALETHVFFKDSAFKDDVAKTNMVAVLEQNGISHVRSL